MPFQPCPETAEVRVRAHMNGQQIENVFHVRVSTAPAIGDLQTIADTVADWCAGPYASVLSADVGFDNVLVTDLNVADSLQAVHVFDAGIDGEVAQNVKTNQDTFCVSLRTGHTGRSNRGRFYILGVPLTFYSDPNHLTDTAVGDYVVRGEDLMSTLTEAGFPLGVLSRYADKTLRTAGVLTDVTSVLAVDNVVDSQNRRLPGRGN